MQYILTSDKILFLVLPLSSSAAPPPDIPTAPHSGQIISSSNSQVSPLNTPPPPASKELAFPYKATDTQP